jgi:pilus assembly protein CpaE
MSDLLRAALFNSAGTREASFRACFEDLKGVHIVAEVGDWDSLRRYVNDNSIDLLVVELDDERDIGFEIVQRIAHIRPNCGIIGISGRNDPVTIIRAMRAGCSQYVCRPVDSADLKEAIGQIRCKREITTLRSRRFCVIGSSGGVGATTIACNLAMELGHISNDSCALVDLNLEFGDVACAFACHPTFSLADVCREDTQLDAVMLKRAVHELPCNVSLLARPEHIKDARQVTPEGVQAMFGVLSAMFPNVVVDLPRAFDYVTAAALSPADRILIVTQLTVPMLRNATRIHRCLVEMGAHEDHIEIVLNRCKSVFERITPEDVESHFGRPPLAMIPNDYRHVQNALDLGHPIVTDSPNTPARLAIQNMARKLTGTEAPADPGAGGFFDRLWGWSNREQPAPAAEQPTSR